MSGLSLILHKAKANPKLSVNIKDIPQVYVEFSCILSHKELLLSSSPLTCKGLANSNNLIISNLWLYVCTYILVVKLLRCINALWLGYMLDIPHGVCYVDISE